ncbi:hypothetical protein A2U01_0013886, partial [Trifolium medium]|nr:hypothetical protein [Trifolium medium]
IEEEEKETLAAVPKTTAKETLVAVPETTALTTTVSHSSASRTSQHHHLVRPGHNHTPPGAFLSSSRPLFLW